MTRRTLPALGLLLLPLLLGACSPVTVEGKVISGNLSVITSVIDGDARLEGGGIEGASIAAIREGRHLETMTATSDEDGEFKFPLKSDAALSRPMTYKVTAEGFLPAQVTLPTPTPNEKLLVVLKPIRGSNE